MQLKSFFFGTNIWLVFPELIFFIFLIAKILPYRFFVIRKEIIRGLLYFLLYSANMLIIIVHNHYTANPIESPKWYFNMEFAMVLNALILNLIHNSGHDFTILKQKIKNFK